jgi:putative transcriptional regulator
LPEPGYPRRLYYMYKEKVCTVIDVDELNQKVKIINYVDNIMFRAFGINNNPTYEEYERFLESRCFPRERDKIKIYLKELDIPFYDPMLIIEKTEGRMEEDDFWIKVEK